MLQPSLFAGEPLTASLQYEGKTTDEIRSAGPIKDWDIFRDGCPGGDSPESMTKRVDEVIAKVQKIHADYWHRVSGHQSKQVDDDERGGDVLIVSHGHFTKYARRLVRQSPY